MSLISRIEVTNYLTEGLNPNRRFVDWNPMLTGITLRMDGGKSVLINMQNGGGKTSLVEIFLYVLSREPRLLKLIREKAAPKGRGFTHARIEFRSPPEDNYSAPGLLEIDPLNMPGETQVIGVALTDDVDASPIFYSYSGTLEDSPCYKFDGKSIAPIADGEFIAGTKAMRGCKWNKFSSRREWEDHIRLFLPIEVIRRNVIYQLKGSDDQNASFLNLTPRGGEAYDSAFFRSVVAPDLLSNLLSTFSKEDESAVEDTLFESLSAIVSSEREIKIKNQRLAIREDGISRLQPVLAAGRHAEALKIDLDSALRDLRKDSAFLRHFGTQESKSAMPGIPRKPFISAEVDKRVYSALKGMVITPDDGIILLDRALSDLIGIEVSKLNEAAGRKGISAISSKAQVIDFACDFGFSTTGSIGGGHYRKGYTRESAALLPEVTQGMTGAHTTGLQEVLSLAFEIAETQIDTNPASHNVRLLVAQRRQLANEVKADEATRDELKLVIEGLNTQLKDRQENEGAWEDFIKLGHLFPEELRQTPMEAEKWHQQRESDISNEINARGIRLGSLRDAWRNYSAVMEQCGLHGIELARSEHDELSATVIRLRSEDIRINRARQEANAILFSTQKSLTSFNQAAALANKKKDAFNVLAPGYQRFLNVFKDADPTTINPVKDLEKASKALNDKRLEIGLTETEEGQLRALKSQAQTFHEIFGHNADPETCDPVQEQRIWLERDSVARQELVALAPLKEALDRFLELHPGANPAQWVTTADSTRERFQANEREQVKLQNELKQEITAIEQMRTVEDGAFVKAWAVLSSQNLGANRLHEVVLAVDLPVDHRANALSALSGLLAAPVFDSIEAMQLAANALKEAGVSVPMLLKSALIEALNCDIESHGHVRLFGFIGGNYSRQVRILLDPDYAKSESQRLNDALATCIIELDQLKLLLVDVSPTSSTYQDARQAAEAQRKGVDQKYADATALAEEAERQISRLEQQVNPAAWEVLHSAKQFAQRGGLNRLSKLSQTLAQLKSELTPLEEAELAATELASRENLNAIDDAVKYLSMGGTSAHDDVVKAATDADEAVEIEAGKLKETQLTSEDLTDQKAILDRKAQEFEQGRKPDRITQLRHAIDFSERGEDVIFMTNFAADHSDLLREQNELKPAARIQYKRAEAFKANQDKSDQDLRKEVDERVQKVGIIEGKINECKKHIAAINNAEIPDWKRLARDIHELAYEVGSRAAQLKGVAVQSTELEEGQAPAEAHAAYAQTAALRSTLQEREPRLSTQLREQIIAVTDLMQSITIKEGLTKHAQIQRQYLDASEKYLQLNLAFCEEARSAFGTAHAAFNALEVEEISKAKPSTMNALANLFIRLQESLIKERDDAQKIILIAKGTNEETLHQLSRLITSAEDNLRILNKVMARYPGGRFFIEAQITKDEQIKFILNELKHEVERANEDAKRTSMRRTNETQLKRILRDKIIECVFTNTKVDFVNSGIWSGKQSPVSEKLSTGQKIALEFMWIVRQAEYEIERGLTELSSKQAAKTRAQSHRVIFIDGIFSTLSDRKIIKEALNGLRDLGGNFQIIGLLHSPTWVNDFTVFPIYHVGKKLSNTVGDSLVSFREAGRDPGTVGFHSTITQSTATMS